MITLIKLPDISSHNVQRIVYKHCYSSEMLSYSKERFQALQTLTFQRQWDLPKKLWWRRGTGVNMLNINAPAWREALRLKEEAKLRDAQMESEKWKSADEYLHLSVHIFSSYKYQVFCCSWVKHLTDTKSPPSCSLWPPPPLHTSSKLPIHLLHFSLILFKEHGLRTKCCGQ